MIILSSADPVRTYQDFATLDLLSGGRAEWKDVLSNFWSAFIRAVDDTKGLRIADHVLVDGGVLCVLTFHSGEDGEVKRYLQERTRGGTWEWLSKKPIGPSSRERHSNPRARSARLRAARRRRVEV